MQRTAVSPAKSARTTNAVKANQSCKLHFAYKQFAFTSFRERQIVDPEFLAHYACLQVQCLLFVLHMLHVCSS